MHGLLPPGTGAAVASTSTVASPQTPPVQGLAPALLVSPAHAVASDVLSGMTEDEQLAQALAMSLQEEQARPRAPPSTTRDTAALDEDALLAQALEASLKVQEEQRQEQNRLAEFQPNVTVDDWQHPHMSAASTHMAASSSSGPSSVASSSLPDSRLQTPEFRPQPAPPLEYARGSSVLTTTTVSCTSSPSDYLLFDAEGVDNATLNRILALSAEEAAGDARVGRTTGGSMPYRADEEQEDSVYQQALFASMVQPPQDARDAAEVAAFVREMEMAFKASLEWASASISETANLAELEKVQAQLMDEDMNKYLEEAKEETNPHKRRAMMGHVHHFTATELSRRNKQKKEWNKLAWTVKDEEKTVKVPKTKREHAHLFGGTEGQYLEHLRVTEKIVVRFAEDSSTIHVRLPRVLFGEAMSEEVQQNRLAWGTGLAKSFLSDPDGCRAERKNPDYPVHVLIDWSNIFVSANNADGTEVDARRFAALIEQDQNAITRFMATSRHYKLIPGAEVFKSLGYTTQVESTGKEAVVDAHVQVRLMYLANMTHQDNSKHTIRLATGDGNKHDKDGKVDERMLSFPDMVEIALRNGYKVEVWSWRASCSRKYCKMWYHHKPQLSIKYLDDFRDYLCPAAPLEQSAFPSLPGGNGGNGRQGNGHGSRGGTPCSNASSWATASPQRAPGQSAVHDRGGGRGGGQGRGHGRGRGEDVGNGRGRWSQQNGRGGRGGRRGRR